MPDGRMLQKKISINEAVAALPDDSCRLLFTWSIPHLDCEGRISGNPRVFKAAVCPLLDHITPELVMSYFIAAQELCLLVRYQCDDGRWAVEYLGFARNQKINKDREAASNYPPISDTCNHSGVSQELIQSNSGVNQPLIKFKYKEVKLNNTSTPRKNSAPKKNKISLPNDFKISDEVQTWADKHGHKNLEAHLEAFIDLCKSNGYTAVDWDSKFKRAIREDWGKVAGNGSGITQEENKQCANHPDRRGVSTLPNSNRWYCRECIDVYENRSLNQVGGIVSSIVDKIGVA